METFMLPMSKVDCLLVPLGNNYIFQVICDDEKGKY